MLVPRTFLRNSIFDDLFSISRELNRYFDESSSPYNSYTYPLTNIYEDKDNYYLVAEIPGIKKEGINVNVTANTVTIEGKRDAEIKEDEKYSCHRKERIFGSFSRTYSLSDKIDSEKITAEYENGVLKVTLAKSSDNKPKSILIK